MRRTIWKIERNNLRDERGSPFPKTMTEIPGNGKNCDNYFVKTIEKRR